MEKFLGKMFYPGLAIHRVCSRAEQLLCCSENFLFYIAAVLWASKSITGGGIRSRWWKPKGKCLHLSLAQKSISNGTGEVRENGVNSYSELTARDPARARQRTHNNPGMQSHSDAAGWTGALLEADGFTTPAHFVQDQIPSTLSSTRAAVFSNI